MKMIDVKTKLVISELIKDLSAGRNEPYQLTNKDMKERFKNDLPDYNLTPKEIANVFRAIKHLSPAELIRCSLDVRRIYRQDDNNERTFSIVDGTLDNEDMIMKLKEAIQDMKDKRTNRLPDELFSYLCELGNDEICELMDEPRYISERKVNVDNSWGGIETTTTIINRGDILSVNQFLERTKFMVLSRFVLNDMCNQVIDLEDLKEFLLWIIDNGRLFSKPLDNIRDWVEKLEDPFQLVGVYPNINKETNESSDTVYIQLL